MTETVNLRQALRLTIGTLGILLLSPLIVIFCVVKIAWKMADDLVDL